MFALIMCDRLYALIMCHRLKVCILPFSFKLLSFVFGCCFDSCQCKAKHSERCVTGAMLLGDVHKMHHAILLWLKLGLAMRKKLEKGFGSFKHNNVFP
jgi:hypothetical protein